MKLLIIGHARHGKDTVAGLFVRHKALKFESSSWHVAAKINETMKYDTVQECYDDRYDNRKFWHDWIRGYNTPDPGKLCKEILAINDMYVGMRSLIELEATADLFDLIIWVDAGERLPPEPMSSNNLEPRYADIIIDNNCGEKELEKHVMNLVRVMK